MGLLWQGTAAHTLAAKALSGKDRTRPSTSSSNRDNYPRQGRGQVSLSDPYLDPAVWRGLPASSSRWTSALAAMPGTPFWLGCVSDHIRCRPARRPGYCAEGRLGQGHSWGRRQAWEALGSRPPDLTQCFSLQQGAGHAGLAARHKVTGVSWHPRLHDSGATLRVDHSLDTGRAHWPALQPPPALE